MLKNAFLFSETPLPKLTGSQNKILEYLLAHLEDVAYMSSAELAQKLNISNATVVRFSQHIGFQGYLDLQRHIRQKIKAQLNVLDRLQKNPPHIRGAKDFFKTVLKSDQDNLAHAMDTISEDLFETVVRAIQNNREMWVLGLRSCHGAAHYFSTNLRYLGRRVNLISLDAGTVWSQLSPGLHQESLLISITFPRYCRQTLEITEQFFHAGSQIVAITDSHMSPLAKMADHVFAVPFWIDSFFESNVVVMSLLNAMLASVSYLDGHKTLAHLQALEQLWKEKNIYSEQTSSTLPSWANQLQSKQENKEMKNGKG